MGAAPELKPPRRLRGPKKRDKEPGQHFSDTLSRKTGQIGHPRPDREDAREKKQGGGVRVAMAVDQKRNPRREVTLSFCIAKIWRQAKGNQATMTMVDDTHASVLNRSC